MFLKLQKLTVLLLVWIVRKAYGGLRQEDELEYLANFNAIDAASYAAIDDPLSDLPQDLLSECKGFGSQSHFQDKAITVTGDALGNIYASQVMSNCQVDTLCVIPENVTLIMNDNLNLGALIVRGAVEWKDELSPVNSYLCAGYIAIEDRGSWDMKLQSKLAWIYIKDNGAYHPKLRSRSFGSVGSNPMVNIEGRLLDRTWSLLSKPLVAGDEKMKLMHNAALMGWKVGDRIAIAPTKKLARGFGAEFRIHNIEDDGTITLDRPAEDNFEAEFAPPMGDGQQPMLKSAEVVNLDRNIVITGDDFTQVACDPNLPEAVPGEQTSVEGCRCSSFRNKCTVGLHTIHMQGSVARIRNVRVEKCGQRGIEGKYCLHFHKLHDCPNCLFESNAVENSQQRGIIVHGTHRSQVKNNILYNVRGAGIYIEDGNEMYNSISYNVLICKFPFGHPAYHGCTIPGTSNRIADTWDNQAGIFSRAATNNLIGNRVANHFNGMFLDAGGRGRGQSQNKVCEAASNFGRIEGNTFHGSGRFGTYTLGSNYPKVTDQSIVTDGHNVDQSLCTGFDDEGSTRGLPVAFENNMDYHNAFVGHYEAGDIQYNGHQSYQNNNLIYWKETKNFENGCSAHITGGHFAEGNMAFPDIGTFIIEDASFGDHVTFEPNHHCNIGTTGLLCMPQYILHRVNWRNIKSSTKRVAFQSYSDKRHDANRNYGGIFCLSPTDATKVMDGKEIEESFFPPGFVSLVSSKFAYLLSTPANVCVLSSDIGYGEQYDNGILCKVPLRGLKIYTRGLVSTTAPRLSVDIYFRKGGIRNQTGTPDISASIGFHQIGEDGQSAKQGYSLPVVPGTDHSYKLSLLGGGGIIPGDWVVEFSDMVIGNRWDIEYIHLNLLGRDCGEDGLVNSHHDRKFIWSGDEFMREEAWGNHGACTSANDMTKVECASQSDGVMPAASCPELCFKTCPGENSYCDCGSKTCQCKAGFSGSDCSIDLCGAARCGEHGTCAAKYLGASSPLPVTSEQACICDSGWSGPLCTFNPCLGQGKTCSGNGQCVASDISTAFCECNPGFSGENCAISCNEVCPGHYPFGCSDDIDNVTKYGCNTGGACSYLKDGESYPYSGFCTFKSNSETNTCQCTHNDCELPGQCTNGQCSKTIPKEDNTPCNSVPFGICRSGICTVTNGPSTAPPHPAPPHPAPTLSGPSSCGCKQCTDEVLNTMAGDHTCGARISWLQSPGGGSMTEEEACVKIGRDEFGGICGICDPTRCSNNGSPPTASPTRKPSESPTPQPTRKPTSQPTPQPTLEPTLSVPSPCGCKQCTDEVLNTMAGDHTCGARISWLQSPGGGSMIEEEACVKIGRDEFGGICGMCDPHRCDGAGRRNLRSIKRVNP